MPKFQVKQSVCMRDIPAGMVPRELEVESVLTTQLGDAEGRDVKELNLYRVISFIGSKHSRVGRGFKVLPQWYEEDALREFTPEDEKAADYFNRRNPKLPLSKEAIVLALTKLGVEDVDCISYPHRTYEVRPYTGA